MRKRRLRQPKLTTKSTKKRSWEAPMASKIDPKSLPRPSRDTFGASRAPPSWQHHLPDAFRRRKWWPKGLPGAFLGRQDHSRTAPGTTPERKKRAPEAFLPQKSCRSVFRPKFSRFFVDFPLSQPSKSNDPNRDRALFQFFFRKNLENVSPRASN